MSPSTMTRLATGAVATVAALAMGGCGLGSALVGVHDAPVEHTSTPPVGAESAQAIATRVLADAARARAATGAEVKDLRA